MDTPEPPPAADDEDAAAGAPAEAAVFETHLHSLPLLARGKVRDNYAVGDDRILMVASDRISAFDVVMNEPIPGKGKLLTEMALFWFDRLAHVVPNHLTGEDPESVVAEDEREQVRGRSMLVKRLRPLPIEAVVRGYLAGSGWKEYKATGTVCGVPLPPGLQLASQLPAPIFTPATKAEAGHHDENIDFARACELIGADRAAEVRDVAIRLYTEAATFALGRGIVIADTKFEFGLDENDRLVLMDEVLTPDSSRYWAVQAEKFGERLRNYDKQTLRDWLETARVDGKPWSKVAPAPRLSENIIRQTREVYYQVRRTLLVEAEASSNAKKREDLPKFLKDLRDAIGHTTDDVIADSQRAEYVIALARTGRQLEAETCVAELRRRREPTPHAAVTIRINIAEGVVDYFGGRVDSSLDKMVRAHKLSVAVRDSELRAVAASWLVHLFWNAEDVSSACSYARDAFQHAEPTNHGARARVSLVLAEILAISARDDLAEPWFKLAQRHAAATGDTGFKSALAFNLSTIRLMQLRQSILGSFGRVMSSSEAESTRNALHNLEVLFGTRDGLSELQTAQLFSLTGRVEEALTIYLRLADKYTGTSTVRERSVWLADESWCFSRLNRHTEALRTATRAIGAIHATTQVDDLASIYATLADVFMRSGGDRSESDRLLALARDRWTEYENFQHRCVDLCRSITEFG